MKFIKIKSNPNKIFGFGQLSDEPREYFRDNRGDWYSASDQVPAELECEEGIIYVKCVCGAFCIAGKDKNGWGLQVRKRLINTASPECCVKAAEQELKRTKLIDQGMCALKAWRLSQNLTRKEIAELSGVNEQNIYRLESGGRKLEDASYKTLKRLADALQCSVEDLFEK